MVLCLEGSFMKVFNSPPALGPRVDFVYFALQL